MEYFMAIAFGVVAGIAFLLLASMIVGLDDGMDKLVDEYDDRERFLARRSDDNSAS
jgi:hypothetical protein